ncbi:uncharacterized protein TNCV_2475291 [Trichonephila clavipes]|nr:uncharacterized protein TNCV_2475291 [Trichonephila clavipes]
MENTQRSQEETKNELKEIMENMQRNQKERMEQGQEDLRNTLEQKIDSVEEKIVLKVDEKIVVRVENLEKKLLAGGNENKSKSVHVSAFPEPVLASPVPMTSSNCRPMTEKRAGKEAAEILQTLPVTERLNLNFLYNALDLRFGQKYSKDYARLQMKTRLQKTGESLQEYAFEIQRLTTLAFTDFSANVREMISFEYFVDGLKDEEIQMAVRMADFKDPKSALLYALKVEAAIQASCRDRHSIRGARLTADAPCESPWIKEIETLREEIQDLTAKRQNLRRRRITS